ncbi:16S rRNA (cytosine(967)-C(5))-methyltransferase RsmB [Sessilibacter corallicola]|uniref:16S rRNA (cytosine(967)-C(5))-methyltransferase RsmB n=1 Tax=Sessilibacter corallicola TaxID=2904075 RepID=UPI001E5A6C7B|nr:16S rRNA (cytosine(967)-C(5))-methyltransferase RsmB [Sessilibacter corallicola]MCE2028093.1 16S rRNA (cytosine(967)-C(5))-methyltransferase RsmB [Sessilibacter corallicola]
MTSPVRLVAAQVIARLNSHQETLAQLLPNAQSQVADREKPLLQELCFGTLRWYPRIKQIYLQLMAKPLKAKDGDIEALVFLGLYQLGYMRIPEHAAISETVDAVKKLKKHWAVKLVNAVLRRYQREKDTLNAAALESDQGRLAHPNWLIKAINKHWPDQADAIFEANNAHPPFTLRVNTAKTTREAYLSELEAAGVSATATPFSSDGMLLAEAAPVLSLPKFTEGFSSVQDEAAQLAAHLLNLKPGQSVLDTCSAPGGKTGHILEKADDLALVSMDISNSRLVRVEENLNRIGFGFCYQEKISQLDSSNVQLVAGDAVTPEQWCDEGVQFDRILLDAPCSATGVIRRHPDIKQLRVANQIDALADLQLAILNALWSKLKPGGRLVYATCSIFPVENTDNIARFLESTDDATEIELDVDWGIAQPHGRQLLPRNAGHDGFYYAVLSKSISD